MGYCNRYRIICKHCCFILYKVLNLNENIYDLNKLQNGQDIILTSEHMNYLIYKFNNMISNSMNNMDNMNNMNIVDNVLLSKYKNIKQQQ